MPGSIRDAVRETVGPVVRLADEVYRRKSGTPQNTKAAPTSPAKPSGTAAQGVHASSVAANRAPETLLTHKQWSERLLAVAKQDERNVVETVLSRLEHEIS